LGWGGGGGPVLFFVGGTRQTKKQLFGPKRPGAKNRKSFVFFGGEKKKSFAPLPPKKKKIFRVLGGGPPRVPQPGAGEKKKKKKFWFFFCIFVPPPPSRVLLAVRPSLLFLPRVSLRIKSLGVFGVPAKFEPEGDLQGNQMFFLETSFSSLVSARNAAARVMAPLVCDPELHRRLKRACKIFGTLKFRLKLKLPPAASRDLCRPVKSPLEKLPWLFRKKPGRKNTPATTFFFGNGAHDYSPFCCQRILRRQQPPHSVGKATCHRFLYGTRFFCGSFFF